jgi:hypothetical protein
MRAATFVRVCMALVALGGVLPAHAADVQRNVLDASINLGWVTETLIRDGRRPENEADVAHWMADGDVHVRALVGRLGAPNADRDLAAVLERWAGWDTVTRLSGPVGAAESVGSVYRGLRDAVSATFDAAAQRWVRGGSCESQFAEVGFHFGRAHIAALRGDAFTRDHDLWIMRGAIQAGLRQDAEKGCGFGARADWDRLPVLTGDASPGGFSATLPLLQEIASRAWPGRTDAVLPPVPGPWGASAENAAPSCRHILEAGAANGDGAYWLDPAGGDPFRAYCDMTRDDGGWTLYAVGAELPAGSERDAVMEPWGPTPQVLRRDRAEALVAVSSGLFRISDPAVERSFFIRDAAPLFDSGRIGGFGHGHVWATNADAVACATSYDQVRGGAMAATGSFGIDCESSGLGSHACGTLNGWILFHHGGTYDYDGQHPCSFGPGESGGLVLRWVR